MTSIGSVDVLHSRGCRVLELSSQKIGRLGRLPIRILGLGKDTEAW